NDARIHDMLAQKMRHVLSGDVIQPTQVELNEYYHNNIEAYQTLPSVSVNEIVLNNRDEIPNAAQQLLEQGASANEILDLSPGTAAPLPNVNHIDLSTIFDPEFADDVFNAQTSAWVGPFLSNRGQHFLQITERTNARLSPLEEILDRVRLDWITQEEEVRLQEEINKLWEQYTIIVDNTNAEQH
ncbi:MAG: peptidylprolyl isomerase, partial [Gammaproteobacteria bacterium]|nr:peptidylprolyl isomerase [Gammaproteobacteria bacterium]